MSDFVIRWSAPILPSHSLAGIPLGVHVDEFEAVLNKYVVDDAKGIYKFVDSPALKMEKHFDSKGEGGYGFHVVDLELTNWRLYYDSPEHLGVETRALHVLTRNWKIYAVKVWMYENLADGQKPVSSYQGKLPENIGLGDFVRELLPYTDLEFDSAEEWFYTDREYGGLEVTGYCCDLNERPDQVIIALAVVG
ncbi:MULTISPECIES: hypothetical protein [unclassified Pseudomonas]|uniref:hypothetical protein n=1 Tax=unclassified Pseudomonas TaxID=196821 RepID=UPI001199EB3C|nr:MULTISPECIES: hypothetical protein [unclassified Pseudomonas]TWC10990.1 hypothetical protein FBX99_1532 [Pseudomonas sp. SJZ074]TWC13358.1 hypothetical protein FBY00_1212 [Pseudomonas sp. SJZ075]TWC29280.1 hypothetical protein FBY06_15313 [Pseudomonas sp. SJZ085]TWC29656.1 hypothetical protein FBY02_1212 [Pseudomonas sp. SJZ078]TWC50342.1 hypothetical protein FBY11_1202 [Pseudomonas sp. SJZ124]